MKTLNLTLAALALTVAGIAPAFADGSDHADQAELLAIAQGKPHADTVVEGRQSVSVNSTRGLSAADALILELAAERDANSKR